jgi:hypothetical protein
MSKHKSLEVINGELLVFGEKLPRHPEYPWLFSATHLHKFCSPTLRKIAAREGKDPDKVFAARRPGEWLKKNILAESQVERVAAFAKYTRRRIKKYGPNLGFHDSGNLDATRVTSTIRGLSDLAMICVTLKGGSGANNLQGTYVAQHVITKYVSTFSPYFEARVHEMFISVLNGEVETVVPDVEKNARKARGTPERKEHKEQNYRLTKACGDKHLLPIHPQKGINLATLGTTAKKFKEATGIAEPLNDNLPVGLVAVRAVATELTAKSLEDSPAATISPKQGVKIGFHSGLIAKRVMHDRKTQETILRETLAADPEARATALKYGLLP